MKTLTSASQMNTIQINIGCVCTCLPSSPVLVYGLATGNSLQGHQTRYFYTCNNCLFRSIMAGVISIV